jgi:DNA-binding transcriptional regulator YdaS (Cro superfamily)
MKSQGLKVAIEAVGGVRELARLLGITHQAIAQWDRVPAERMLEIERVTGIARERLRPDLYREQLELPLEIAPASDTSSDKSAA